MRFTDACLDPAFGYENGDGYVRIRAVQGGNLVMRHRWFWEISNGPIPDGMEINHLCKNRRCCNPSHLEVMDGREHAILSNRERYAPLYEEFKRLYSEGVFDGMSQPTIAKQFGRTQASISRWLKRMRDE